MNNKIKQFSLLSGDVVILYFSLYLTLFIRYGEQPTANTWKNHFMIFSTLFLFWIIIFYISNLYSIRFAVSNAKFFNNTIKAVMISALLSVLFFYLNSNLNIAPKTNLFLFLIIFIILFFLWRLIFNRSIQSFLPKNNIALIGYNKQSEEMLKNLKNNPHLGYRPALILQNLSGKAGSLKAEIKAKKIDTIVLAENANQSKELRSDLIDCLSLRINIINFANFYEQITGKVPIEAINQSWFLENLNESNKKFFDLFKRIYDFGLAVIILIISAIFWIIIAIIIKFDDGGEIFFKQKRSGKHGKPFTIIKFRTMKSEGNDYSPTESDDKRVTKFGKLLRTSRIDEIPQILNIILGDMSFIGPRPERPEIIKELTKNIPFYKERMLVKPGLSGWDQVSGEYHSPSISDSVKKMQYDLFYIKNRSIYLDLSIMLKTVSTIISRGGR